MSALPPVIAGLALALLGAHALRAGEPGWTAACLLLACLAWMRRAWVRWTLVAALVVAVGIWGQTAGELIRFRLDAGLPWSRLALILGGVGVLTLAAFGSLLTDAAGRRYADRVSEGGLRAAIAVLTAGALFAAEAGTPFPILLAERFAPGWGGLEIGLLALYAQWIGGLLLEPRTARKVRPRIWGLFSAVFFLQLGAGLLGLDRMLMTGTLHLPVPALIVGGPLFRGGGYFMLTLYLSTVLLVGPAWCSHLCYVGAWDDACSRLGAKRPRPDSPGSAVLWGRALTLGLTVLSALGLRYAGVPGGIAIWAAVLFGTAGVAVMVFFSRRSGSMVHCAAFCPVGLVGNLLGRLGPWRMRMNEKCTACGACARVCRYGALEQEDLERGRPGLSCTLCGDCTAVCGQRALEYGFPGLSPARARRLFLVLVVVLHATFLGVARI